MIRLLEGGQVFFSEGEWKTADILIENDRICQIGQGLRESCGAFRSGIEEIVPLRGRMVLPGLCDLHIHGADGWDTCDDHPDALRHIACYLASVGVTAFLPTTMSMGEPELAHTIGRIAAAMHVDSPGARILGAHIEGPYSAQSRAGVQRKDAIRKPSAHEIRELMMTYKDVIRIVDLAPEIDGAFEFCEDLRGDLILSVSHTDATYEEVNRIFRAGATHATHLFNAMTGLSHRFPGAVGAVLDAPAVTAEIICDGIHIHPAVLRIAFRLLGEDRAVIVSDAMRATGRDDGDYELGGQIIRVSDGRTIGPGGGLAGSVTTLLPAMRRLREYGVPFSQIIRAGSLNPARVIGDKDCIGGIREGNRADLIVTEEDLTLRKTMIGGRIVYCDD